MSSPRIVLFLLVFFISTPQAHTALLHVPDDYTSIQAGIAAARTGDTVLVAPGLYFESLMMKPGIHVHGQPGAILDGSQAFGPVVRAFSGVEQTAVLSGFVIRRGRQEGILLNQAALTIRNNVIIDNTGPGIVCAQASPHILNNIIANNGGGVVCQYPGTLPVIVYNTFWQNRQATAMSCPRGEGNRNQAPEFVDAQQGDYRLRDASPLIDAGHPESGYNDVDGSRSDMGIAGGPQPAAPRVSRRLRASAPLLRNSLSFQGLPGLIDIPTATMVPPGSVDLGFTRKRDTTIFPTVDEQGNFNFAVGLLPRVTIGGRGTEANDALGNRIVGDISANAQLLLLQEGLWWPAVAAGFQDISGGNNVFESNYLVLSKSLFGRVRTTVGLGTGPDTLDGPFAGMELSLNRFITLMGEYDADDINAGIRLFPLPQQLEAYGLPRPTVDLIWQDGDDFAWGVSLRVGLGEAKYRAQRAALAHKRYHRWIPPAGEEEDLQQISEQLQAQLIADGLENVRVAMVAVAQSLTVVVEYENRRYNRDELQGLGVVMGLTATHIPPAVTHMRIVVKEANVPVLQVTTRVDDFLAFLNERLSPWTFAHRVQITNQVPRSTEQETTLATTAIRHRSWLKLDAFLRPGIDTTILTEFGVADLRFSLLPDAFIQLTPGAVFNIRGRIPVTKTPGFPRTLGDPKVDRVLLHQVLRLPLGRWSRFATGLTQFSVGRFNLEERGIVNETALTLLDGLFFLKSTVARVGSSFGDLDRWVALANGRVRYPPWDLTLSVTGGRFRDGDEGVAAELSRFFGNTEIGVFIRHSGNGSLGGIRLAFPLTLAKSLKPMRFRPRLPDVFQYEQRTTVFTDRNVLRFDIGRTLPTGHNIERIYWNRDRLYPAYIRQHVNTLKRAVRRWIDEKAESVHTEGRK